MQSQRRAAAVRHGSCPEQTGGDGAKKQAREVPGRDRTGAQAAVYDAAIAFTRFDSLDTLRDACR